MCLSSLLPPNPSIFYLHPAFLTPPQAPHLLHSLSSSPLHSTFLTFTSGPLPSISPPLSLLLPPPEPVLPHSFCSSALTLLHAPCCLSSPPWHPSYTLVFFRKLSDLFHTILSSPLASQAHGILSAPCSLAAQGPDSISPCLYLSPNSHSCPPRIRAKQPRHSELTLMNVLISVGTPYPSRHPWEHPFPPLPDSRCSVKQANLTPWGE